LPRAPSTAPIPLYSHDGAICDWIDEPRLKRLEGLGMVHHVVRRRKGRIARAVLCKREGECGPLPPSSYGGTRYCYRQHLKDGHMAYRLRSLGERHADERNLAPESVRQIFLTVLLGCMRCDADVLQPTQAG